MRVELRTPFIETRPKETSRVVVAVQNTAEVIDDIVVHVVGLDPSAVRVEPARLPLFPGAEGTVTLIIRLPPSFPAGDHSIPIEVRSTTNPDDVTRVDLRMAVAVDDDVSIDVRPRSLTGGKRGEFEVLCTNRGNRPIDLTLIASDLETALKHEFDPPFVELPAGHEVVSLLRVTGRRPIIGGNALRRITVTALGPDRQLDAEATFSQLPRIRRAPVTFLILASIIGLWALLFTFAINTSLSSDPHTMEFPGRAMESIAAALSADEPVAGAAATRLDPMATGGSVTGNVRATNTDEPVGRITVEAIRQTRDGPRLATAAATNEAGEFELVGLAPGRYTLRFTAPGFEDVWYPGASTEEMAVPVQVTVGNTVEDIDVAITGEPGGIVGSVDVGEAVDNVTVTVTARAIIDGSVGSIVAESTTDATNTYSLAPLATPGSYELTFTAPGYQLATSEERIEGGQIAVANTVRLSAGEGSISGSVTSGGQPLGGVTIHATSGDQRWTTATPTSGVIGAFELVDLPTPGTYTLTFELDGYSSETVAIALGPGESRVGLNIDLVGGTGGISGRVTAGGQGLGDVTVTVTGGPSVAQTTTLTAGDIGSYRLSGLQTPARYTLTFSREGYRSETIAVDLTSNQSASGVNVSLSRAHGSITGQVIDSSTGDPLSGVDIVITDGTNDKTSLSASSPPGQFLVGGLTEGAWSLTFSREGYADYTQQVVLIAGQDVTIGPIQMSPSP
jgi:5-hydroxyisourate hydrolase-like protein (transthyretin family)